jgi:hypothetical protein
MFVAACKCGQLRYEATSLPRFHAICHCADCRSATGQPSVETAFFVAKDVAIHGTCASSEFVSARGNRTYRDTCPQCKEVVADRSDGFPDLIGLFAARFQPALPTKPQFHMWVESAVAALPVDQEIPQFMRGPILSKP